MTISEKLSETIAQKERIASEVVLQSDKITEIKSGIYDILESDELPKSKLANLVDGTSSEITASDLQGVTKIRDSAFYGNEWLESIEIPDSVTSLGDEAFRDCRSITSLTIPNSVTRTGSLSLRIGSETNKATITFLGTTPPTIYTNTFVASQLQNIIVPKGCGDTYKSATNWSNFADYIVEASE